MENVEKNNPLYESTVYAVVKGLQLTIKLATKKMSYEELKMYTNTQREKNKAGFELISNKLFLRYVTADDIDKIKNSLVSNFYGKLPQQHEVILEFLHKEGDAPYFFTFPIEMALLALRLYKEDYVAIPKIAFIDIQNTGGGVEGDYDRLVQFHPDYFLTPDDFNPLKEIFNKLMKWDWKKSPNYELAYTRFGKSYDEKPVDKIIDLYIGLESLFCTKDDREKGKVIGNSCSKLIGGSESDKAEIRENLIQGYRLRNEIVHGGISETTAVYEIHPFIEGYLRASLYQLIINEK